MDFTARTPAAAARCGSEGGRGEGQLPVVLAVGGSDSCGGAGLQADIQVLRQWGVHGAAAVTAVTAQNTVGVQRVRIVSADMVAAQMRSVAEDMPPAAVKTGMLANSGIARAVAAELREGAFGPYVLDPVVVATSGDRLLARNAMRAVREELLPLAALVTPNWPEAVALTGVANAGEEGMEEAARALVAAGAGAALVKGGHLPGTRVADMLWDGESLRVFRKPRLGAGAVHGTGCALGAAAAAGLARGRPLGDAVAAAVDWVHRAIAGATALGSGARVLDFSAAPPSGTALGPSGKRSRAGASGKREETRERDETA